MKQPEYDKRLLELLDWLEEKNINLWKVVRPNYGSWISRSDPTQSCSLCRDLLLSESDNVSQINPGKPCVPMSLDLCPDTSVAYLQILQIK